MKKIQFNGKTVTVNGVVVKLPYSESAEYAGCFYRKLDIEDPISGTKEEWINPPMIPGVVYRTAKRNNGKPVYKFYDTKTQDGTYVLADVVIQKDILVTISNFDVVSIKSTVKDDPGYGLLRYLDLPNITSTGEGTGDIELIGFYADFIGTTITLTAKNNYDYAGETLTFKVELEFTAEVAT